MGIRSIQVLAFATLAAATTLVAAQTTPLNSANECRATPATDDAPAVQLAAMFTGNDAGDANAFADASLFVYAVNDNALASEAVTLVDVGDVANCARRKNII